MLPAKRIVHAIGHVYRQRFFQVGAVTLSFVFLSALVVQYFEQHAAEPNIHSFWDGVWWAVVTMGTVGYGDKYPVSVGGRVVGLLVIFTGVGLMSLFTATVASMFVEKKMKEGKGLETIRDRNHFVVCGWNRHIENILEGLRVYGVPRETPIALINDLPTDEIDALRVKYARYNVKFLRGDFVHDEVLVRANVSKAKCVMILADPSGGRPLDRLDERTVLAALTLRSVAPQTKVIAELLDAENRPHLKRANVDEIIVRGEHVGSLLAGAATSPGLPKVFSHILALGTTNKIWQVEIPRAFVGKTFQSLGAHYRAQYQAILIGLIKEKKSMKLEDLLTDSTSVIDNFIREKLRESHRDILLDRDQTNLVMNPDDNYLIGEEDHAIILARSIHKQA